MNKKIVTNKSAWCDPGFFGIDSMVVLEEVSVLEEIVKDVFKTKNAYTKMIKNE